MGHRVVDELAKVCAAATEPTEVRNAMTALQYGLSSVSGLMINEQTWLESETGRNRQHVTQ
jgi:hypothetical protein